MPGMDCPFMNDLLVVLRCTANNVYRVQRCCWIDLDTFTESNSHQYWNCWDVGRERASRKGHAEGKRVAYSLVNMGRCHKGNHEPASSSVSAGTWEKTESFCYHKSGAASVREAGRSSNSQQGSKPICSRLICFILGLGTTIFATLVKSL